MHYVIDIVIDIGHMPHLPRGYSVTDCTCNLCDARVIGNEFLYIFKCKAFYLERKLYIPKSLRNMTSILEMHKLFNSRDVKILLKLVKFITIINAKFA